MEHAGVTIERATEQDINLMLELWRTMRQRLPFIRGREGNNVRMFMCFPGPFKRSVKTTTRRRGKVIKLINAEGEYKNSIKK